MKFYSRRIIKPTDLNPSNNLFGGQLLSWIDEEAAIFASCQMKTDYIVTKYISEINFQSSAKCGDVIEFGLNVAAIGTSSLTLQCIVRRKKTNDIIISINKMVFVSIDKLGKPTPHGITTAA